MQKSAFSNAKIHSEGPTAKPPVLTVRRNDQVVVRLSSDKPLRVHLHGDDIESDVVPNLVTSLGLPRRPQVLLARLADDAARRAASEKQRRKEALRRDVAFPKKATSVAYSDAEDERVPGDENARHAE